MRGRRERSRGCEGPREVIKRRKQRGREGIVVGGEREGEDVRGEEPLGGSDIDGSGRLRRVREGRGRDACARGEGEGRAGKEGWAWLG